MLINDYKKKIDDVENKLGTMVDQKLQFKNPSKEQAVVVAVVNDCIDLIEEIQRSLYAFEVAYDSLGNAVSFRPTYYYENIILQDDMIWERIILLVGIVDQLDVNIIFERKSIDCLYALIKKHRGTSDGIVADLIRINGDSDKNKNKKKRNNNEHGISTHLENREIAEDIESLIFIKNDHLEADMEVWQQISDRHYKSALEEMKKNIPAIKKRQDIYIQLIENIINELYVKNAECKFDCADKFLCANVVCNCNFVNEALLLERNYMSLREKHRKIIDGINEHCLCICDETGFIRNTLLTDAIFRAKEVIRSVNLYFGCLNYNINKKIRCDFSEEDFYKFLNNEVIMPDCYLFHAYIKTYSVCEKVAKFMLCKYDFNHKYTSMNDLKNMYVEDIIAKIDEMHITSESIELFKRIMKGKVYSHYEKMRNLEYHCLRQQYLFESEQRIGIMLGEGYEVYLLLSELYLLLACLVDEEGRILSEQVRKK